MRAGGEARPGNSHDQKAALDGVKEDTHSFYICLYLHFKVLLPVHLGMKQKGRLEGAGGGVQQLELSDGKASVQTQRLCTLQLNAAIGTESFMEILCMDVRETHFILQTDFTAETRRESRSASTLKSLSGLWRCGEWTCLI